VTVAAHLVQRSSDYNAAVTVQAFDTYQSGVNKTEINKYISK
jgi:hypothetical protein